MIYQLGDTNCVVYTNTCYRFSSIGAKMCCVCGAQAGGGGGASVEREPPGGQLQAPLPGVSRENKDVAGIHSGLYGGVPVRAAAVWGTHHRQARERPGHI